MRITIFWLYGYSHLGMPLSGFKNAQNPVFNRFLLIWFWPQAENTGTQLRPIRALSPPRRACLKASTAGSGNAAAVTGIIIAILILLIFIVLLIVLIDRRRFLNMKMIISMSSGEVAGIVVGVVLAVVVVALVVLAIVIMIRHKLYKTDIPLISTLSFGPRFSDILGGKGFVHVLNKMSMCPCRYLFTVLNLSSDRHNHSTLSVSLKGNPNSNAYSPRDEERNQEVEGGEAWKNPYYHEDDNKPINENEVILTSLREGNNGYGTSPYNDQQSATFDCDDTSLPLREEDEEDREKEPEDVPLPMPEYNTPKPPPPVEYNEVAELPPPAPEEPEPEFEPVVKSKISSIVDLTDYDDRVLINPNKTSSPDIPAVPDNREAPDTPPPAPPADNVSQGGEMTFDDDEPEADTVIENRNAGNNV
eukprot:sb/3465065/